MSHTFSSTDYPVSAAPPSAAAIVPLFAAQPPATGARPALGLNGAAHPTVTAKPNDPLAGMTPWKIYQRCIWISEEDANTKIMLLCVSRFMDRDLRASSMSYTQIARDCGFSERTAKRCAQFVANTWLRIGVGKGRYIAGKGHENRYDGIIPQKWVDELRRRILGGITVQPDEVIRKAVGDLMAGESGVSTGHPEEDGVPHRHPEMPISGCQADTGVPDCPKRGVRLTHVYQTPPEKKDIGADVRPLPLDAGATDQGQPREPLSTARERRGRAVTAADAEAALAAYNDVAAKLGFIRCVALTQSRRTRLQKRLDDIGGIEEFKRAVSVIHLDDWLMGRVRKEGRKPFKLDIDSLLQTDGRMGDVLAKLLDKADAAATEPQADGHSAAHVEANWWKNSIAAKSFPPAAWRTLIKMQPANRWPVETLGPPPGTPGCLVPADLLRELSLI